MEGSEVMNLETNAQYTNPVTDEERALIADFIAKNGVTKVARGESGLPDPTVKMHWKDQRQIQRRVYLRKRKFEQAAVTRANVNKVPATDNEALTLEALQGASGPMGSKDVAEIIGLHQRTAREHLRRLIAKGLVETVGASSTTRYRVAA